MPETYAGFIDVGFLRAEGSKRLASNTSEVRPNAEAVVEWFRRLSSSQLAGQRFLRAYWYDGAFDTRHAEYEGQRRFLEAIASTPGIQLRLGNLVEHPARHESGIRRALRNTADSLGVAPEILLEEFDKHWRFYPQRQQRGVDTLVALDLVRLASRSVCSTSVLISGDRDLAEAVRTAQDFGVRVLIATPNRASVARELAQIADDILDMSEETLANMLPARPALAS